MSDWIDRLVREPDEELDAVSADWNGLASGSLVRMVTSRGAEDKTL